MVKEKRETDRRKEPGGRLVCNEPLKNSLKN
jgi:hypothetical protein